MTTLARLALLAAGVLILPLFPSPSASAPITPIEQLRAAAELLAAGRMQEARDAFAALVEADPSSDRARRGLASWPAPSGSAPSSAVRSDTISMAGASFPVVGLADASRAAKIAVANVYVPIDEAQKLAAASSQVQSVSPFSPADVNLLFIKADQEKITDLASALRNIVDKKATIGTPDSFLKLLGSFFALSDKLTMAASLIAIIVAVLIAFKTMAGNIAERAREIGVLKAVGWTNRNVVSQLLAESVIQCFLAGILGLVLAAIAAFGLSFMNVNIPIPWDMSPTPHFLPGGGDQIYKTLRLPVHIPWILACFGIVLSVVIGGVTGGILGRSISKIKPSEVLRHE